MRDGAIYNTIKRNLKEVEKELRKNEGLAGCSLIRGKKIGILNIAYDVLGRNQTEDLKMHIRLELSEEGE